MCVSLEKIRKVELYFAASISFGPALIERRREYMKTVMLLDSPKYWF